MTSFWLLAILAAAVIMCGMIAGFFLTFSDFLMRSLKLAKTTAGIEVMQIINREVWKSITIFMLWGMVALSVALGGYASLQLNGPLLAWVISGSTTYVLGMLLVSYAFNIPMNNRLDALELSTPAAATYWHDNYVDRWVFWNYVRAIASATAAICFFMACLTIIQSSSAIS